MSFTMDHQVTKFLSESLSIEGIYRVPTDVEIKATIDFLNEPLTADTVITLQATYAPKKPLRDKYGMGLRIGDYIAPKGCPDMRAMLDTVLQITDPWECHIAFESLHPFMDGNGRTGRTVWAWKMYELRQDPFSLPFLHRFYYQTLAHSDGRK